MTQEENEQEDEELEALFGPAPRGHDYGAPPGLLPTALVIIGLFIWVLAIGFTCGRITA